MQLTRPKKILGGLALASTLALTGIVGFAQQETSQGGKEGGEHHSRREGRKGWHGGEDGFAGRFAAKLNLSDAQKEQMKQISARYKESTKALFDHERAGGRDNELSPLNGGAFNEAAVRAAAQARANAHVEMEVARARMMSEMYALLTPEQKTQLAAERQQREQKRQEWRARRGANTTEKQ